MDDILFRQTAKRYAQSWDHPQPTWYHLEVMLTMWLPAMLALPWAIHAWRRRLRRGDARYLLPLAWWALVVLFFSRSDEHTSELQSLMRISYAGFCWKKK